ncbi:MAG: hypothetical protein IJB34_07525 [Clostridia bacterium]|nr:hypothetical protein [Clostridia bacterium]
MGRHGSFFRTYPKQSENAPEGATERCADCPHQNTCLYDAKRIHVDVDQHGFQTWEGLNKPKDGDDTVGTLKMG